MKLSSHCTILHSPAVVPNDCQSSDHAYNGRAAGPKCPFAQLVDLRVGRASGGHLWLTGELCVERDSARLVRTAIDLIDLTPAPIDLIDLNICAVEIYGPP
jgi:hypothetical protein